jgi:iron complex outermembrane recepter protein
MNQSPPAFRLPRRFVLPFRALAIVALAALAFVVSPSARAADTGAVAGRVLDANSGKYLEGAEAAVLGSALRATTDRSGRFTLAGVSAGSQQIVVTYPGLEPKTELVSVTAGQTTDLLVQLTASDVVKLDEFRVQSAKEGMAQAIALQKVSIQSKLVAAADQFGVVSEGNVGEYLKFLPGVSVDYNANDARGISLRGLSTTFTIVAVDGTPMAATSSMDDTRRFEFEQIAMNNVETTELYKTVTPDIPASATGGYVNFVTKSAFDRQDVSVFNYDISLSVPSTNASLGREGGVWGRGDQFLVRPSVELNYARHVNEKLGVNFNYRLSEIYHDSPRVTYTWVNDAVNDADGTTLTNPRLQTYTIKDEQKMTHREAFASKVDYKLSDATTVTFSGQWNWYDLLFQQRGPQFTLGTGSTRSGNTFTSGPTGYAIGNNVLQRNKYGTTWHFNGTLNHDFGPGRLAVTGYWSKADGAYRDATKGFTQMGVNIPTSAFTGFSLAGPNTDRIAGITVRNGGTTLPGNFIRELGNYSLTAVNNGDFQSRPWTAEDTKVGGRADYVHELDGLVVPLKFQVGVAVDNTERTIDRVTIRNGTSIGLTGSALAAYLDQDYTDDVAFGYGPYQAPDIYSLYEAYKGNLTVLNEYLTRRFDEDNQSAYLRLDSQVTPDLLLIGGVRWEKREIDAAAQNLASTRSRKGQVNLSYDNFYPSISFKYAPQAMRSVVVRGGFSRTVGHPDYAFLAPSINSESSPGAGDGSITVPAPDVQPFYSKNYDISVDYYLPHGGVLGAYLFRKEVENPLIQRSVANLAEAQALASAWGYNPAEFNNGAVSQNFGSSEIMGVELSYNQQFSFLPKPFNGLSLQTNFTMLDVDSSDIDTQYSQLRAVSPKTFNVVLSYRYNKFTATTTTNWVDDALFGGFVASSYFVGTGDSRLALYRSGKATTDIKLEYSFNRRFSAYFLVRNIFNKGRYDFARTYLPNQPQVELPFSDYEFGDPLITVGLRGTF